MCGIAGLFAKTDVTAASLGAHLADMLVPLSDRGPDSAGVAIYREDLKPGSVKLSLLDPAGHETGGRWRLGWGARRLCEISLTKP